MSEIINLISAYDFAEAHLSPEELETTRRFEKLYQQRLAQFGKVPSPQEDCAIVKEIFELIPEAAGVYRRLDDLTEYFRGKLESQRGFE